MPTAHQWVTYDAWTKRFGDIVSAEVLRQKIIILGSVHSTTELLERRSAKYFDRVHVVMLNDLMGCDIFKGFLPYGDEWRMHRRAMHTYVNQTVVDQWKYDHAREVAALLRRLCDDPEDFSLHTQKLVAATVVGVPYGIRLSEKNDWYTKMAEETVGRINEAALPGAFLANELPLLKHLPTWFPGVSSHRKAAEGRRMVAELVDRPMHAVKAGMAHGAAPHCMMADLLARLPDGVGATQAANVARGVCGIAYLAGADTSFAVLLTLFHAVVTHAQAQARAQAELDAVMGRDRLPTFADTRDLPYLDALTMAYRTPSRRTMITMCISYIVIGNIWMLMRDFEAYPDPDREAFEPERFLRTTAAGALELDPSVRDPRSSILGFGRRVCPGRHLAEQTLFSVISVVLAVYMISPVRDENGVPVIPAVEMVTKGLVAHQARFRCNISPKSEERGSSSGRRRRTKRWCVIRVGSIFQTLQYG